jgi:hypothetical protein
MDFFDAKPQSWRRSTWLFSANSAPPHEQVLVVAGLRLETGSILRLPQTQHSD